MHAGRTKRSGNWSRVTLMKPWASADRVDVLGLDDALTQLAAFDPRKSQIAELRFFGGLTLEETGELLGLSLATVERDWQAARAWLFNTLSGIAEPPGRRGTSSSTARVSLRTVCVFDVASPDVRGDCWFDARHCHG